ncbi:hypothetical protein PI95_028790 [Hassallia byssoidea VB512170]|uniref:Uncharacterized protein n=1 Tax=Hassallia byssoidea VB512170 TaxID=1304833 RepID=A0A846HH39_9CYAN|nr:hypothetical protein [Hassalia byssoidea]NEU76403.1 hypothetical protein [Hassalia byssoidea VB512170]
MRDFVQIGTHQNSAGNDSASRFTTLFLAILALGYECAKRLLSRTCEGDRLLVFTRMRSPFSPQPIKINHRQNSASKLLP